MIGGVNSIALATAAHEQAQLNRVWFFRILCDVLASKGFLFQNIFLFMHYNVHALPVYEPPHDKTNTMACAPSEDSDLSLGIRPV